MSLLIILDGLIDRDAPLDLNEMAAICFTSHPQRGISSLLLLLPQLGLAIEGMTRNDFLQASVTVWKWLIIDKISTTQQGGRNEDVGRFQDSIRIDFIPPR